MAWEYMAATKAGALDSVADVDDSPQDKQSWVKSRVSLPGMQLTERDIQILHFINDFGFCEMPQVQKMFGLVKRRSYQIMERLIAAGLVKHERVFHGRHGIYRLSKKGAGHTSLPALARITLGNYNHSLAVLDVYLHLRKSHPDTEWLSERHLIHEKYFDGVGKHGHLPDGIMLLLDKDKKEQKIAIEVELRSKAKARIESILKWYTTQFDFTEVWYFCPQGVAESLRTVVGESMPFVKIRSLREIV
jgi:hypothetical protein